MVGLGPAGASHLTDEVRALVAGEDPTYLRTERHPAAASLVGYTALDEIYESAATFDEVYQAIVEVLVKAATAVAPRPVVYAVPGSPLVAERTVDLLRADPRVDLTVVPGLSFLDLAWERLGVDPLAAGVRLIDAEQLVSEGLRERGPYLVAQCWSQDLLSEIKLTPSFDDDDEEAVPEVVLLHHLGLEDERVIRVGWWDLDRTVVPDHLTSLYLPDVRGVRKTEQEMGGLEDLVATLRAQCPWDRVQTHASLMPHLLEESYEVLDALHELAAAEESVGVSSLDGPVAHLEEELGDLLFQVVFHARLAQEAGRFTLADVARGVHDKLVHRHPHVFGDGNASTAPQVAANWEAIKREEKGRTSVTEGIPVDLPALSLSTKLARKALSVGMSGPGYSQIPADLPAWFAALLASEADPDAGAADAPLGARDVDRELLVGQVLFELANLSRRLGVDPELALRARALALRDSIVAKEAAAAAAPDLPLSAGHTH